MAKPHRMFALTVTAALAAGEPLWRGEGRTLLIGLAVIAAGTAITVVRRTRTLAARLSERDQAEPK